MAAQIRAKARAKYKPFFKDSWQPYVRQFIISYSRTHYSSLQAWTLVLPIAIHPAGPHFSLIIMIKRTLAESQCATRLIVISFHLAYL